MRIPAALYLLAFALRALVGLAFAQPGYPDSAYYVDVAREIAAGHGLTVPFVWIFPEVGGSLPANPVLPVASNAHWMPLASFVQVPFILVLGPNLLASTLPFVLIGALAAPLAYAIGRDAGLPSFHAAVAGVLVALGGLLLPYTVQQDNFALIEVLTAGALFLGSRGLRGSGRAFVAAGLLAGLASLARTDAALVLVVLGLGFLWDRWRTRRPFGTEPPRPALVSVKAAAGAVAAWLLVMGPWFARQLAVFGSISPSSATGKVLWIRDFSEWNSITIPADPAHLLGMGILPLVQSRALALAQSVEISAVLGATVVLLPFILWGAWRRRRDVRFGLAFAYAGLFLVVSVLLFAPHVPGGMFIHSAIGLVPHAFVLAVEALVAIGAVLARRSRTPDPDRWARLLGILAIALVAVMAVFGTMSAQQAWAARTGRMQLAAHALDAAGAGQDERVMSVDAAGYYYLSGHPGVVTVNDPIDTVEAVARAYGIRWLVLEPTDAIQVLSGVNLADDRPAWIGAPVLDQGSIAVYPVCLADGDTRCSR